MAGKTTAKSADAHVAPATGLSVPYTCCEVAKEIHTTTVAARRRRCSPSTCGVLLSTTTRRQTTNFFENFCRSKFNFSRRAYIAQVLASLMTTMALRHAFDIPGGKCRIQNVDESMCYMFNSAKRS